VTQLQKAGSGSVWDEIFNAVVDALRGNEGRQITAAAIDSQAASDGDVLTADGAGGAAWEAGGGSQPGAVRRLDLGAFDITDLLAGPVLLYTPAAGEVVGPVFLTDVVFTDAHAVIVAQADGVDGASRQLAAFTSSDWTIGILSGGAFLQWRLATSAVSIGISEDTQQPLAEPWQADHAYTPDPDTSESLILAAGHLWLSPDTGDSGSVEPDFAGNIGGTVVDNDLTWTDDGVLPTQGSCHVYADVTTPVAP